MIFPLVFQFGISHLEIFSVVYTRTGLYELLTPCNDISGVFEVFFYHFQTSSTHILHTECCVDLYVKKTISPGASLRGEGSQKI